MRENKKEQVPKREREIFHVGDMAVWDEDVKETVDVGFGAWNKLGVQNLISKHGRGPFEVVSVRDNLEELVKLGHPRQILMLKKPDGQLLPTSPVWVKKYISK